MAAQSHPAVINVNGRILTALDPKTPLISVFDRAYLYGDSLYEVVRTYNGRFFGLEAHLTRLTESAKLCRMLLGQSAKQYRDEIVRTFEAFRAMPEHAGTEAYMRIIVSRGVGKIGFGLSCVETPTQFVIIVQPIDPPSDSLLKKGLSLSISNRLRNSPRALDPAMKSGNYLNSLLAYLEAAADGYDDALMVNSDGHLTEGTTFNFGYIRRGIIATPPLDIGILDGITRRKMIELAQSQGIEVREIRFPQERLFEADEVFVTSSIKEIFPVTRLDGKPVGSGNPGPMTLQLRAQFQELIRKGDFK